MKKEKKNMRGRRKMSEFFCCCCCCVHLSFFLSRFQNELVTIIFSLTCREEDDGTDCSFPPASAFSFSFSSSLRWRRIRER